MRAPSPPATLVRSARPNGAGAMPSVMRPITNPGRTTNRCTPRAVQGVGEARC